MVYYSSRTYEHKNFIVRYPHLRRLEIVSRSIEELAPNSWLDFGAGDGAVFRRLASRGGLPDATVVLYEPGPVMRGVLTENLAGIKNVDFRIVASLDEIGDMTFDVVTALEVLEHLPLPERTGFYDFLAGRLVPDGNCLIEVPIEYGPVLFVKEFGRHFLKGRKSEYSFLELLLAGTVGIVRDSKGRYDAADTRLSISPHCGFDLRRFSRELKQIGDIRSAKNSPFPWLPRWLNQCTLLSFKPHPDGGDVPGEPKT